MISPGFHDLIAFCNQQIKMHLPKNNLKAQNYYIFSQTFTECFVLNIRKPVFIIKSNSILSLFKFFEIILI